MGLIMGLGRGWGTLAQTINIIMAKDTLEFIICLLSLRILVCGHVSHQGCLGPHMTVVSSETSKDE